MRRPGGPAPSAWRRSLQPRKPIELARNLAGLKGRGWFGGKFVVSDNHEGLKRAIGETPPEIVWQHCGLHFLEKESGSSRTVAWVIQLLGRGAALTGFRGLTMVRRVLAILPLVRVLSDIALP